MLIDPAFVTELTNGAPYSTRTLDFLKKIVNAFIYAELSPAGAVISGQIKKGDGTSVAAVTNVIVRALGGTIAVNTGTAMFGAGTNAVWLQTTGAGAFQVTITGSAAVEFVTNQGIPTMAVV